MRIGQNPAKNLKEVAIPQRITVAVLNYIPMLAGFYSEMLDVLKACLNSIYDNTDLPYDLLVFDNGSCSEVLQYLLEENEAGRIQYLWTSEKNIGKGGAWNIIFGGAPGEIIAYTDNDCIFSKGWLSKSVELLETYPNVGMVTARPYRTPPEFYTSTLAWAGQTENVQVEAGQLIPFEVLHEFNLSLGQTEEFSREFIKNSKDYRLTFKNVPAIVGGSHWQFTAKKSTLQTFLPFQMDRPMGQVRQLDQRMNELSLLRLMLAEPYAMNLSNTVSNQPSASKSGEPAAAGFWSIPFVKKIMLGLHDWVFRKYFQK